MPKIYPIIKKVIVQGGGGNVPPGAAVMTDSGALAATVFLGESNAAPTDSVLTALKATYAETDAAQTETLRVGVAGLSEANTGLSEDLNVKVGVAETTAAQMELLRVAIAGLAESNPAPSETLKTGFAGPGLAEASSAPGDTQSATTFTYATTQVSVGNGATNGANATGQNNGTNANVTTVALGDVTCSVTPKIPRASVPNAGTYRLYAWYKTVAGAASTFTLTYTDTGGNPVNITLTAGDFSVTPFTAAITSLHATNDITVLFRLTDAAAGVSPGVITVDAIAIRTVGAF